jgi:hypothetical protein
MTAGTEVHRQWEAIACLRMALQAVRLPFLGDQNLHFEPERLRRLAHGVGGLVLQQPCVAVPPPSYGPSILSEFL